MIKERFNVKEEIGKSQLAQAKHLLDTYVVLPVIDPLKNEVNRRANKTRKKMKRAVRQVVEVRLSMFLCICVDVLRIVVVSLPCYFGRVLYAV